MEIGHCGEKTTTYLACGVVITSHIVNKQRCQAVYKEQSRRPSNLVDESWPCDLSVINGYDSPRRLCAVEDRYPYFTIIGTTLPISSTRKEESEDP
ncbi:hypothetical protein YC2023_106627 [Brassica napus]